MIGENSQEELLSKIQIRSQENNQPVVIVTMPSGIEKIGVGTDGAVFRIKGEDAKVFKVFPEDRLYKLESEYFVYQKLKGSPYFSRCFGKGRNYLILSYETGPTLYQCLQEGIVIPKRVIEEVDQACEFVKKQGLNPQDIHLKNIIFQDGHAKIIDVADFTSPVNDGRWNLLREGYEKYYHLIKGRKIPFWILELVRKSYLSQGQTVTDLVEDLLQKYGLEPKEKGEIDLMHTNPSPEEIKKLLQETKKIAVVGLSDNPDRASYQVAAAMQQAGYRIIPVNPKVQGKLLGEKVYTSLREIAEPIDMINIFRRSDAVPAIVEEALQLQSKPKAIWMQLGIVHEEAAKKAEEQGIKVVMDRCLKVEHALLLKNGKN